MKRGEYMNNKGFTVVELLASFTLTMIIVVFLFEIVLELKDVYMSTNLRTISLDRNAIVTTELNNYLNKYCSNTTTCNMSQDVRWEGNRRVGIGSSLIEFPDKVTIKNMNFWTADEVLTDNPNYSGDNRYFRVSYTIESAYFKEPIKYNYVYTYRAN